MRALLGIPFFAGPFSHGFLCLSLRGPSMTPGIDSGDYANTNLTLDGENNNHGTMVFARLASNILAAAQRSVDAPHVDELAESGTIQAGVSSCRNAHAAENWRLQNGTALGANAIGQ